MQGAPTLDGTEGSGYAVLKWALPQLGWTIEYDDDVNFKIVFRNNPTTGTGTYLEVVDNAPYGSGSNQVTSFRCYQTMTGIETGTGRTPDFDHGVGTYPASWIRSQSNNSTNDAAYRFVGTDRGFYMLSRESGNPTYYHIWNWGFFGDMVPYNPGDVPFLMQPPTYDDYYYSQMGPELRWAVSAESNCNRGARFTLSAVDGTTHDASVWWKPQDPAGSDRTQFNPGDGYWPSVPGESQLYFIRPFAYEHSDTTDRNYPRGFLPRAWFPVGDWISEYSLDSNTSNPDGVIQLEGVPVEDETLNLTLYTCGCYHNSYIYAILMDEEGAWYE